MEQTHGYDKRCPDQAPFHCIEGQVRGIEWMVEEDRYCIDVLTRGGQDSARKRGLPALTDHVNHCVAGALESGDQAGAKKSDGLLAAVQRFARTA